MNPIKVFIETRYASDREGVDFTTLRLRVSVPHTEESFHGIGVAVLNPAGDEFNVRDGERMSLTRALADILAQIVKARKPIKTAFSVIESAASLAWKASFNRSDRGVDVLYRDFGKLYHPISYRVWL